MTLWEGQPQFRLTYIREENFDKRAPLRIYSTDGGAIHLADVIKLNWISICFNSEIKHVIKKYEDYLKSDGKPYLTKKRRKLSRNNLIKVMSCYVIPIY